MPILSNGLRGQTITSCKDVFFYFAKHSKQFRKFYDTVAYPIDAHYYNTPEFRKLMDEMVNEIIEKESKHFEIAD